MFIIVDVCMFILLYFRGGTLCKLCRKWKLVQYLSNKYYLKTMPWNILTVNSNDKYLLCIECKILCLYYETRELGHNIYDILSLHTLRIYVILYSNKDGSFMTDLYDITLILVNILVMSDIISEV